MLDNLTQRMARVVKTLRGEARLTEANTQEMLREVRLDAKDLDSALMDDEIAERTKRVLEDARKQEERGRKPGARRS